MQKNPTTQKRISASLDVTRLERETNRFLAWGLLAGIALHALLFSVITVRFSGLDTTERHAEDRITVDLVYIPLQAMQPPSVRPHLPRHRQPERLKSERETPSFTPDRAPGVLLDIEPHSNGYLDLSTLCDPHEMDTEQSVTYDDLFERGTVMRQPSRRLSLREDMLNLDDLDELGIYKGLLVRDLDDVQQSRGFIHVPQYVLEMELMNRRPRNYLLYKSVQGLGDEFRRSTGIQLTTDKPVSFYAPDFSSYPVVYVTTAHKTGDMFLINNHLAAKLRRYMESGGFLIIDNGEPWYDYGPVEASLLYILYRSFGEKCYLKPVPTDHPIFTCFFPMFDRPPEGAENWTEPIDSRRNDIVWAKWAQLCHIPHMEKMREKISRNPDTIWGIWLDDRLAAIYSDKGYGHLWHDSVLVTEGRRTEQLQFGVNMFFFAMAQKGGLTERYVSN